MKIRRSITLFLFGIMAFAENRFNRPVVPLANPTAYKFYKLDDNNFPYALGNGVTVSCITYRGSERYYVEVGVSNTGTQPIMIAVEDFVSFEKPGYTMLPVNTLTAIADIVASSSGTFVRTPPPPPTGATTTSTATATTYGNTTQVDGTSTTTVDNSAAGWHALGQAMAQKRFYKAQSVEHALANYLQAVAHETQPKTLQPGEARIYAFTFQQLKPKKAPFAVAIRVGDERFSFNYKE